MIVGDVLPRSHIPPLPPLLEKRHKLTAVETPSAASPSAASPVSCEQPPPPPPSSPSPPSPPSPPAPPSPVPVTSSPRDCHVPPHSPHASLVALVQDDAEEESTTKAPAVREEPPIEEALVTDVIVCNFPERTLEDHTVKELQQMCAEQGLSTIGKKKLLCDRLRQRSTADGEN